MTSTLKDSLHQWLESHTLRTSVECDTAELSITACEFLPGDCFGTVQINTTSDEPHVTMTMALDLAPIKTLNEALMLLALNEYLVGCALFVPEEDDPQPMLITNVPMEQFTTGATSFDTLFQTLLRGKSFLEEE